MMCVLDRPGTQIRPNMCQGTAAGACQKKGNSERGGFWPIAVFKHSLSSILSIWNWSSFGCGNIVAIFFTLGI